MFSLSKIGFKPKLGVFGVENKQKNEVKIQNFTHKVSIKPKILSLQQGRIFNISLGGGGGGGGQIMGVVIFSLAQRRFTPPHLRKFFPDIVLLARRNFAHTIQDLL